MATCCIEHEVRQELPVNRPHMPLHRQFIYLPSAMSMGGQENRGEKEACKTFGARLVGPSPLSTAKLHMIVY